MAGLRKRALAIVVVATIFGATVAVVSACSSGAASGARLARTSDVLELRVRFLGKWGTVVGPARESYSPATGLFATQGTSQGKPDGERFDGSSWTTVADGSLERQSGPPALFRWLFAVPKPLSRPGVAAVDVYLGLRRSKAMHVVSQLGGRVLRVEARYPGTTIKYRVSIVGRVSLAKAKAQGRFSALPGRLDKDTRAASAGTAPKYAEPAYWFGPMLGRARGAGILERWQREVAPGLSAVDYTTIYRLPRSVASPVPLGDTRTAYPGLGNKPASDISLTCYPRRPGVPVPTAVGTTEQAVIATGERATVKLYSYKQGPLPATQAQIVVHDAFCSLQGPIAPSAFRAALSSFAPVG